MTIPIEARVQRLEDIEAVRVLMARYHRVCDGWGPAGTHVDPEAIADVFTEDGVWGVTSRQPAPTGRAEIIQLAEDLQTVGWIVHFALNFMVNVDGDTASGESKALLRVKFDESSPFVWGMGLYRFVALRTAEGWRFQSLLWEPFVGGEFEPPRRSSAPA
jgi:ketosteroid isomerase-like protein